MTILRIRALLARPSWILTFSTVLVFFLVFSGCENTLTNTASQQSESFDGEALFRGIFFGQGTVPSKVPVLEETFVWKESLQENQKAALNDFVDDLVLAIENTEPAFFKSFADALQSGDHVRIDRMLVRTNEVTIAALEEVPAVADWREKLADNEAAIQAELIRLYNANKISQSDMESAQAQLALLAATKSGEAGKVGAAGWVRGWALAVAVVLAAAVVVPPVVLAAALTVVVAYAWAYSFKEGEGAPGLQREQIIHGLATQLAV